MTTSKPNRGTKSTPTLPQHVQDLRRILGDNALLLPCRTFTKRPSLATWGNLTIDEMRKPAYLRKLVTGNIGVALGITSAGLVSIDVDDDDAVEPFLALNPALLQTFRTK